MIKTLPIWLAAVAQPALAQPALAQPAPDADAPDDADRGTIVVTAVRAPTPIDEVASSVTVLDKQDIDTFQDADVTGLLLRTPGVSVSRTGGYGATASLRLRGAEGDQTMILLDGVKLVEPAATNGSFDIASLLTGDAARIEILRGPQSTLWGSQAIAGVVNIITAAPTRPLEATFDIQAGSRETVDARAGLGGKQGPVTWRLAGQAFTTAGISALDRSLGGREADGYRNQSASGRVEIALAEDVIADLRGYYAHGRADIDGFDLFTFAFVDSPEVAVTDQWLGYAGLRAAALDGRLSNRIGFSYTDMNRNNVDPRQAPGDTTTFRSDGSTRRVEYEGRLALATGWNAVFGIEHEWSEFRSISPQFQAEPDGGRASFTDEYLELNVQPLAGLTLTGGVRHNDDSTYGGRFLFSAGGAWTLGTGTLLRARYGEGFKAPSLYQLYSQYGTGRLEPTRASGWEAGIEQHGFDDRLIVGAGYFSRRTRDLVIFNSCFGTAPGSDPLCDRFAAVGGYYRNLGSSFAEGVELTGSVRPVDGLSIDANYSWIRSISRSAGSFGNWLPRRPRVQGNATLSYRWPFDLSTAVSVRWAGQSFEDEGNQIRLAGYAVVDVRAELPLDSGLSLFARVENLADEEYQTVFQYGQLGRSIYAGIRGRF